MANAWAVIAALLAASTPLLAAEEFPGCSLGATEAVCTWSVRGPKRETFDLPSFSGTQVLIEVRTTESTTGRELSAAPSWDASLETTTPDGTSHRPFSSFRGAKDVLTYTGAPIVLHVVLPADANATHRLVFTSNYPGTHTILYRAWQVPEGEAPARPAASLDEPQLMGLPGSGLGAFDLLAAWLTDDALGDGLFEARIAVRDLADTGGVQRPQWRLTMEVAERIYFITWEDGDCALDVDGDVGTARVASPACETDLQASILLARIPEKALGDPAAGVLFTGMAATTAAYTDTTDRTLGIWLPDQGGRAVDRLDHQRFGFALGGPAVWDALNGCRFCEEPAAWAEAPFSEEHLANTLQLVGAVMAVVAFLAGVVVVRHRRMRVKRLFDQIDAVARDHDADARAGLLALGALESDFDARYRAGRLHENEYQLASQRIATAATRLSLRRQLGLDDGAPGDDDVAVSLRPRS